MNKNYQEKIKILKIQLGAAIFAFMLVLIVGVVMFGPNLQQVALALNPADYNLPGGSSLTVGDWNDLDADFVARDNGIVDSNLDMGGNQIQNVGNPLANNDAANKQYVDSMGGGETFINWGRNDCPGATVELYDGYGFGTKWDVQNGDSDVTCIQGGDPGSVASFPADQLWPVTTGQGPYLPPGYTASRIVQCAVCHVQGACYQSWGTTACNVGAGFNSVYTGYMFGGFVGLASPSNRNVVDRQCINSNFDASIISTTWNKSVWYGVSIADNTDVNFAFPASQDFVKCAVCCNN